MARSPRSEYLDPSVGATVLLICGSARTPLVPAPYESGPAANAHRVHFIESHFRNFAKFFCISVHALSVLTREVRIVLENHPDQVRKLDDAEVARRWLTLCPTVRPLHLQSREITEEEILAVCADTARIAAIRSHLSDISWFLRLLQQRISRYCNAEDGVNGHFWSARYRAILLLDDMARWLATANVDLGALWIDPDKPLSATEVVAALQLLRESLAALAAPLSSTNSPLLHQRPAEFLEILDRALLAFTDESPISLSRENAGDSQDLRLPPEVLTALLLHFDLLFSHVAGSPSQMAAFVTRKRRRRAWVTPAARQLLRSCSQQSPAASWPPTSSL